MCGIIGYASSEIKIDETWLREGLSLISHRGPDDHGTWISTNGLIGLGHRRLSILDLTSLGHQPMSIKELGLFIVFNGEIYNYLELKNQLINLGHSFISNSDTEVLLRGYSQWGNSILSRINGMFSFGIFDSKKSKLLLARDRSGEKPLFYSINNNSIYFCSELKGLLCNTKFSRKINYSNLNLYLGIGFVPGSQCIVDGFNKLPAGSLLEYDLSNGKSIVREYWNLPEQVDYCENINLELQLESLLEDAVKKQLVADVPVGILLSGGLDSSIITALAARSSDKIKTFSISFPGHGKLDESNHARLVANYFSTEHIELVAEEESADLLSVLAKQFDEPIIDSSMIPTYMVSRLVRNHCTVALGGDGGDELFGGYSHYTRILLLEKYFKYIPYYFRNLIASTSSGLLPQGFKGRNYLKTLNFNYKKNTPLVATYFDKSDIKKLLNIFDENILESCFLYQNTSNAEDLLQRLTRTDFKNYLAEDILVKVDRSSMLNSLEIRAPFLDYRVIEFAFGKVPSYLKCNTDNRKILLKRIAKRILPPEFDLRRKQGFSIPLNSWLKNGPYKDLFWDTLTSCECVFDKKYTIKLLQSVEKGYSNSERLFGLVLLELWRKHYNIQF